MGEGQVAMVDDLVQVQGLTKWFPLQQSLVENLLNRGNSQHLRAVDGVSFTIRRGEVFGLAGESGSGKTTTGRLILRLLEPTAGKVIFDGVDLAGLPPAQMRRMRRRMQIIFQDPYASLNPRMKLGDGIGHGLVIHGLVSGGSEKRERVQEMMDKVGLTPADVLYDKYPHQLSGGQRQRAVMARALITHPDLVVADEPIAMADVSVRALLLQLMLDLKEEFHLTYLFVTHDLATAKYICDRIAIMYLGQIVEMGPLEAVYGDPQHPYTSALLSAVPIPDPKARRQHPIPRGEIPNPINPPSGCRFHPRCPYARASGSLEEPRLVEVAEGHFVACHLSSGR
jgi:peptide/nickel transport system ATP-binding protein